MILDSNQVVEVDVTGAPQLETREPWLRRLHIGRFRSTFTPVRAAVTLHPNGQARAVVYALSNGRDPAMRATFDEGTPPEAWPDWLRDIVHRVQVAYEHGTRDRPRRAAD